MKHYPSEIKNKARTLRERGFSLTEISDELGLPKNTLSGWVKDIKLTKLQKLKIKEKIDAGGLKGRKRAEEAIKTKIELWKKEIRNKTDCYVRKVHRDKGIEKLICGILYLCEGAKYPSTRHLVFGNSDPLIIKLFMKLLRRNFKLDNKKFRCRIMHRWDQDGRKLNKYWSKQTGISLKQFYKSYKDKRTKDQPTKNKEYKGICSIQYFDTNIQFELQAIGESLLIA